jgi:hypothetical protein
MAKNKLIFDPKIPTEFVNWFGAPAVLTSEDLRNHNSILCGLYLTIEPQDFIELVLISDLAYYIQKAQGLRRLKVNVIRQANKEKFERLESELVLEAKDRKEKLQKESALDSLLVDRRQGSNRDAHAQTKLAIEFEKIDTETNKKSAELQKAKDGPIDEAASFDQWIDRVERIDKELAMAQQNIRITLKLLDEHRTGLGQRLRQATDEIIDVEVAEESAPAREEVVRPVESACRTEVSKELTGPMTASSVTELASQASSQTNGAAPLQLDGPLGSALSPSSGPAEQQ